jgi:sugar phosphate isomerase/epimerase
MNDQPEKLTRRSALARCGLVAGAAIAAPKLSQAADSPAANAGGSDHRFVYCLNTATIRGYKLGIVAEMELAAKAGYEAVEPWVEKIHQYAKDGGSLKDLGKRISDLGLTVESAIGFPEWIVDDEARRAKGLEQAKSDMDVVAQIGGKRLAAPPAGATKEPILERQKIAERYRALLELGDTMGVVPELEIWGFSKNIQHLSDATFIALETHHPKACVLADIFHLHKGGSNFDGLRLLSGEALQLIHMNDYPAEPGPEEIDDAFRVFPGDGVAPLTDILKTLRANSHRTVLSLELFNHEYWKRDSMLIAKTGVEKMKAAVAKATS